MKAKNFAIGFGLLSFCLLLGIGTFYLLMPSNQQLPKEVTFDEALTRIENKEISEATIKQFQLDLVDKNKQKFFAQLDASDAPREAILKAAGESRTKVNLEPASNSSGWILLINALSMFLFFFFWAATLGVIVYAVKTLSKNKG